ncbi:MAG: LPS export ABC transporter periplasmic protein LptC [Bacteroidota bacterium]
MMKQLTFLLLYFTLLCSFWACENDMSEVRALQEKMQPGIETAREVEILYSDSAQIKVRIEGETMLTHLDRSYPRQEFTDGIWVEFFDEEGAISSTLAARYAVRQEKLGKITVRDSVVWKSVEQDKLETEELIWDEKSKKVYTNKFVVITRPDEIIYGHGFEADQDFSNARIKAVDGRVKVEDIDQEIE